MLFKLLRRNYTLVSNAKKFKLPPLDYRYDELETVLSKELLTINHYHTKHHKTYIDTKNPIAPEFAKALSL